MRRRAALAAPPGQLSRPDRGVRRQWRDAGWGRGVRVREAAGFAGGWLARAVALASPVHPWGGALFSVHLAQHEILMLVAAPLLVLGKPAIAGLKALPPGRGRQVAGWAHPARVRAAWGFGTNPFVAWLVHAAVPWVWHVPACSTRS